MKIKYKGYELEEIEFEESNVFFRFKKPKYIAPVNNWENGFKSYDNYVKSYNINIYTIRKNNMYDFSKIINLFQLEVDRIINEKIKT